MEEAAIFAVGTFWFWVLVGSACSALIGAIEYDKWGGATFTLLFSLFLLDKYGDVPVWSTIWAYPLTILAILGVYLAAGTLWAIAKWWFFVRDEFRTCMAKKDELVKLHGDAWQEHVGSYLYSDWWKRVDGKAVPVRPLAKDHAGRIYIWLGFWPWSAAWTFLNDPVKRAFKAVYRWISGLLDRISESVYKDY